MVEFSNKETFSNSIRCNKLHIFVNNKSFLNLSRGSDEEEGKTLLEVEDGQGFINPSVPGYLCPTYLVKDSLERERLIGILWKLHLSLSISGSFSLIFRLGICF